MAPAPVGVWAGAAIICPVCGKPVAPDRFGRLVCRCGWAGPGDPLESSRGFSRFLTQFDRRLANRLALHELELAESGSIFRSLNIFYRLTLLLLSILIYVVIFALLAASVALTIYFARDRAWLGVLVSLFLVVLLVYALSHGRVRAQGVTATRDRFPALFAALDEVSARTGGQLPHRVVLVPDGNFFVYQHRPLRRLFWPERVLAIGVATLSILSEEEAKAILAHELAHYRNLDTTLNRYFGRADRALYYIIQVVREAAEDGDRMTTRRGHYRRNNGDGIGTLGFLLLVPIAWVLLLPLRLLWITFRLLRLAESRRAEFLADRLAVQSYGAAAFIGGLANVHSTMKRLAQRDDHIANDMGRRQTRNYYAAQRSHYGELPEAYREQRLREAVQDFPSLENSHPTLGDRVIAARMQDRSAIPALEAPRSATDLIIPLGESNADAVEIELSDLLLARRYARRRR